MDECWRITCLLDAESLATQMFVGMNRVDPPLFSLFIYVLAQLYNVEFVLRLVSLIPGILAIPLAYLVARQLFSSRWLAVLSSFLTAFSLELMVYSKELKPYSLCAFVHLCILYGYLKYRKNINARTTFVFTTVLALSIPLSLHSVFAFPGVYLALFAATFRKGTRKQKKLVLFSCVSLLALAVICFFLLVGGVEDSSQLDFMKGYWGNDLCPAESIPDTISWLAPRYLEHFTDLAFTNRLAPPLIGDHLHLIYPVLALLGFIALLLTSRRRFFEAACLFVVPLLVMAIFSMGQLWPFGQLRMNLFVIFYILFPPLFILDQLGKLPVKWWKGSSAGRVPASFGAVGVAIIVCALICIQFPLDFREFSQRRAVNSTQASAQALEHILDVYTEGPQIPLVANHLGQSQFRYYSTYHRRLSVRYNLQADLFDPREMRTRSSAFYLRGSMLRICQESRQAAIYLAHYLAPESMLYRSDFCFAHDSWSGERCYSCLVTSEIYEAARNRQQLFPARRFSGKGDGWEQVYISPALNVEDAGPGSLVVFNFDFDFHSANKRIRLAFLDENDSTDSFDKPEIDYDRPIHDNHLESAAHVKLNAPVKNVRLSISAKNSYDFSVKNLEYFVAPEETWEEPDEPFHIVEDMCERIKLLRRVRSVDHFWETDQGGFGWTNGNGVIELDDVEIDPGERVFMLETFGRIRPELREEPMDSSVKIFINFTHRAPLIKIEGEDAAQYYFHIPADVRTVKSITIKSDTFIPSDLGINDDGRSLGLNVKAIGFPRIIRDVNRLPAGDSHP